MTCIKLTAYYAGQLTKEETAALKYRERNEEKFRADARSTKRNLYKPNMNRHNLYKLLQQ